LRSVAAPSGQAQLAVAMTSFTGLPFAGLRGLDGSGYDGETIIVRRNLWLNVIGKPKTNKRRGASDRSTEDLFGYVTERPWPGIGERTREAAEPRMDHQRCHAAGLREAGIKWHGWHDFQRGLATNLDRLGVSDTVIQAILRHSSVRLTRQSYIKSVRADVVTALHRFEQTLDQQPERVPQPNPATN
jgi:integrase